MFEIYKLNYKFYRGLDGNGKTDIIGLIIV